ncbi:MAG: HK97 gp10 family phage protein [Solirubrobacterales bacterium]|nr:HK97 gp10 family phage protein [Solirubrobacterales bacterium]
MADTGGARMTEIAADRTPVDSGEVRDAWKQQTVRQERDENGDTVWVTGTENPHWRAPMVERGVKPQEIKPRKGDDDAEAITTPEGPRASVDHPGFAGAYMTQQAAAEVEAETPALMRGDLETWSREAEAAAKRRPGIR